MIDLKENEMQNINHKNFIMFHEGYYDSTSEGFVTFKTPTYVNIDRIKYVIEELFTSGDVTLRLARICVHDRVFVTADDNVFKVLNDRTER